jgi:hypothetical protein
MQVTDGVVVLEAKDCTACKFRDTPGKQPKLKWHTCPKCKGTGKRGNGKCRECNSKYPGDGANPGYVKFWDHDDLEACAKCGGDYHNREVEGVTDNLPTHVWANVPIVVRGSISRPMTTAEQLFGAGIYTIIDYGAHKVKTDDELIEYVRFELDSGKNKVQASKVVKSAGRDLDLTFCSGLAIIRADQGFSVIPYFGE